MYRNRPVHRAFVIAGLSALTLVWLLLLPRCRPMTSAVQMLAHGHLPVSRCQDIHIDKHIFHTTRLWLSPDVILARCHVTVKSL
jgi:hypothetical protein